MRWAAALAVEAARDQVEALAVAALALVGLRGGAEDDAAARRWRADERVHGSAAREGERHEATVGLVRRAGVGLVGRNRLRDHVYRPDRAGPGGLVRHDAVVGER